MNKTLEKQLLAIVEVIKTMQNKLDNNAASLDIEINEILKIIDTKDKESNTAFKGILKTLEKLNNKVDKDTHDTNIGSLKSELKALETILQSKIDNKQDIVNIKEEIDNVVKDYATKKELDLVEDKIKLKQDTIDIKSEINKVVKDYATKNELDKSLKDILKEVKTEKIIETIKEEITTEKPTIEVGKVITAEAGSIAKVEIRKVNDIYYLDFTIPKGTSGKGSRGANGVGIATGGTTNQVLAKNSNTDYDTKWVDNTGGTGTSDHSELTKLDYASAGHTGFQPTLVSGTSIKTINNTSLLGSGNITVAGTGDTAKVETITLTATHISNKYLDLEETPIEPTAVDVFPNTGIRQTYNVDYTVTTNGTAVKRISWNELGLLGLLEENDKITISYSY